MSKADSESWKNKQKKLKQIPRMFQNQFMFN